VRKGGGCIVGGAAEDTVGEERREFVLTLRVVLPLFVELCVLPLALVLLLGRLRLVLAEGGGGGGVSMVVWMKARPVYSDGRPGST
jgi:hypothetical protein